MAPGRGSVVTTIPTGTVGFGAVVRTPAWSPMASRALIASSSFRPASVGTATVLLCCEATTSTVSPSPIDVAGGRALRQDRIGRLVVVLLERHVEREAAIEGHRLRLVDRQAQERGHGDRWRCRTVDAEPLLISRNSSTPAAKRTSRPRMAATQAHGVVPAPSSSCCGARYRLLRVTTPPVTATAA